MTGKTRSLPSRKNDAALAQAHPEFVPLTEAAWASRSTLDQLSKSDSLDLADHNLVFRSVVELGRARRLVAGHLLGVLKTSAVL
jgi:hypothetical protein